MTSERTATPTNVDETEAAPKQRKSELTRTKIVDAALQLFEEKGYEQTTMRAIAQRAGVSLGNAYYYFSSKEDLMQGYYAAVFTSFTQRAEEVFDNYSSFEDRLANALYAWVDNARPYHEFAGGFFKYAANPKSPLSPFSAESEETRERSIELHRRLLEGSKGLKLSGTLREQLPQLLWMYQMGIVLFWVYDDSENEERTRLLIGKTVPLLAKLISLARLPVLRGTVKEITSLVADLNTRHESPPVG